MLCTYTPQQVEQNRNFYLNLYDASHQLVQIGRVMNWHHLYEKLLNYYISNNQKNVWKFTWISLTKLFFNNFRRYIHSA